MDESTNGVTLYAGFIFDVLEPYRDKRLLFSELFEMVEHLSADSPTELVPIQLYNDVCDWIEARVGEHSIRNAGEQIGKRIYQRIIESAPSAAKSPRSMMYALKEAAQVMIQDPKGRGWVIEHDEPERIRMRRTQTFNCMLQEGLLRSLAESTGARYVKVEHAQCTRRGDEFCVYELTWRE